MTAKDAATGDRPAAILFDWDNTLVDTWPVIHDSLNTTFRAFGLEIWTLEQTKERARKSMRDSFPALFGDQWEAAGDVFYGRFNEIHIQKLTPMPGAADMLQVLAESGIYLGIVSNKRGDLLRTEASHLGWNRYFGAIIGANDTARDKPARDPVDAALIPGGVRPNPAVWFAGDADIDLECAKNANCTGVLVGSYDLIGETENQTQPNLQFADCMALCNFLKKL